MLSELRGLRRWRVRRSCRGPEPAGRAPRLGKGRELRASTQLARERRIVIASVKMWEGALGDRYGGACQGTIVDVGAFRTGEFAGSGTRSLRSLVFAWSRAQIEARTTRWPGPTETRLSLTEFRVFRRFSDAARHGGRRRQPPLLDHREGQAGRRAGGQAREGQCEHTSCSDSKRLYGELLDLRAQKNSWGKNIIAFSKLLNTNALLTGQHRSDDYQRLS